MMLALNPAVSFADEPKKDGLYNESGAGIVVTGGNTETQTISLSQKSDLVDGVNAYKFFANFLRASNRGVEQAKTWGIGARYERGLSDNYSLYLGQLVESNIYQNILQRYATDFGMKHVWRNLEKLKWFSELGYRFTRENIPSGHRNLNFARVYNEVEYLFSKTVSTKWWFEVLPNITDMDGYQYNTELSLSATLSDVFSVKSGYLIRYYNTPPVPAKTTDTIFTTALVAKF